MGKVSSLLKEIESLPVARVRNPDWFDKQTPEAQREVSAIIDRWIAGEFRDKFPNKTHLARWIGEKCGCKYYVVNKTINEREQNVQAR